MVSQNDSPSPAAELSPMSAQKVRTSTSMPGTALHTVSVLEEEWGEETAVNRHGTWWYAAFHYVTAMVGAGVLSLPYAMGPGVLVLVLSWGITLYTSWQLIQLHEHVPGRRFSRYHELGQYAFGPKLGLWVVLPQQLIVQLGCDIVYMVTGGKSLEKFADTVSSGAGTQFRQSFWICIFGAIHVFLSQLPNFDSVAGVSLAAAIMSIGYSTISWVACLARGRLPDVSYGYRKAGETDAMFRVFSALGQISFTYAGHVVLLEVQATIPSSPEKPSKVTMWRGSVFAYLVAAACYFPTALIGYWAFGQDVDDNVLISLGRPALLVAAANLMVVVHVIGSYQVYAMPVFHMTETLLVEKFGFAKTARLRLIARTTYVVLTLFVAVTFPFFADLLGFFGGLAFAPSSFFVSLELPCIIWLAIKKPRKFSLSWLANWGCIVLGLMVALVSMMGGLRNIIVDASTYHFFG
ncbi:Lysine histidine transporter-like 6 [Nymphaea thermarum]|nr:Lysine histidine transporter-like 6 [Nymphaea thermarum]